MRLRYEQLSDALHIGQLAYQIEEHQTKLSTLGEEYNKLLEQVNQLEEEINDLKNENVNLRKTIDAIYTQWTFDIEKYNELLDKFNALNIEFKKLQDFIRDTPIS